MCAMGGPVYFIFVLWVGLYMYSSGGSVYVCYMWPFICMLGVALYMCDIWELWVAL